MSYDIPVFTAPFGQQGTLPQLEGALAEAGIAYAIVEQDEQRAFARQLDDALCAGGDVLTASGDVLSDE